MAVLVPAVAPPTKRTELDQLQGVWTSIAGQREARFLVAGNRFAFEFVAGDLYIGTFVLGATGQMDMHVQEGPCEHKGLVAECIYHLDGGVLRWCPGRIGAQQRPRQFPSVEDDRALCIVFRHVPRNRKK